MIPTLSERDLSAAGGAEEPQVELRRSARRSVRTFTGHWFGTLGTGPLTPRGKRRSSLNRQQKGLCPASVAQELRARGEDPKAFRSLHRDLISWLIPDELGTRALVEELAEAWWKKKRRLNSAVGVIPPNCQEIDARIDDLLQRLAWAIAKRHRKWRDRWTRVLGERPYGAKHLRLIVESRVPALGGKPHKRRS